MGEFIKVEVGQVWYNRYAAIPLLYKITKIVGSQVFALYPTDWHENEFGRVDSNGYPENWDRGWVCKPIQLSVPVTKDRSLFDFFKSVRPGHCSCDIPIERCDFHRPEK